MGRLRRFSMGLSSLAGCGLLAGLIAQYAGITDVLGVPVQGLVGFLAGVLITSAFAWGGPRV